MSIPVADPILGTGLSFPFAMDPQGGVALAHGVSDVEQAIAIILATAPGERPMRPEFGCGVHDLVFETFDAATVGRIERAVEEALGRWEPRIEVLGIACDAAGADDGQIVIEIDYRLRATNHVRNLVYPFYLIPEE